MNKMLEEEICARGTGGILFLTHVLFSFIRSFLVNVFDVLRKTITDEIQPARDVKNV